MTHPDNPCRIPPRVPLVVSPGLIFGMFPGNASWIPPGVSSGIHQTVHPCIPEVVDF